MCKYTCGEPSAFCIYNHMRVYANCAREELNALCKSIESQVLCFLRECASPFLAMKPQNDEPSLSESGVLQGQHKASATLDSFLASNTEN